MNSLYFAQYLVNEEVLTPKEGKELIREAQDITPGLAVVALAEGAVSAAKLAELMPFEKDSFAKLAVAEGLLFASQVEKLQEARSTDGLKPAQALLDSGKMDFMELGRQMAACGSEEINPVREAVRRIAEENEDLAVEEETYADFTELFMRSLMRFMDTPAIIHTYVPEEEIDTVFASHIVSQRLSGSSGAVGFVSGIYAGDKVFVELARRYSHELINEADELAEDSVAEFLNVVNGLFVVDLGKKDYDLDLEAPRIGRNTRPMGSNQLQLGVDTGFGSFALVLAEDEISLVEHPF